MSEIKYPQLKARETYEDAMDREPIRDEFYNHLGDVSDTEMSQISLICEEFTHDFLGDYYGELSRGFELNVRFEGTSDHYDDYATILDWNWESRDLCRSVLFRRDRNHITFEDYEAEVKSYLFDLIIMMLNL